MSPGYEVDPATGCWNWLGYRSPAGYGRWKVDGRAVEAHRAMYEFEVGTVPEGLVLDHLCRNKGCVNPEHLEPVTLTENFRRGRHTNREKVRCIRGHEFTPENTYHRPSGGRVCRACVRERSRKYRERERVA